ncbi:MAG: hypothetical protein KKF62_18755 [Bacteroidetes bacterium]|nr:hypothetical protein [Bacteroidota bacterium]MBU1116894.1 hypothetical protein [Bacteroidota bacterium]MBU1797428.1 hypothetical protein [Bacteroidota bacterium]
MGQISKLTTTVRTTEINSVTSGIIAEYSQTTLSSDAHLATIFEQLQPINAKLTESINRIKAESNLEEKDELRDNKIRAINYLALGFEHHPDATISNAAKIVNAVFEHYGMNLVNESYATESSLIASLLLEFGKADLQASIALLPGLSQLIDELSTIEAEFEEAQLAFQTEKATDGNKESATEIKKELLTVINEKLVVYLRAMVMVDEAKYGAFVGVVSQIIDDMNVIIKKRKKTVEPVNTVNN